MANKNELREKYSKLTGKDWDPNWTGKQLVDKIRDAKNSKSSKKDEKDDSSASNKEVIGQINALTDAVNKIGNAVMSVAERVEKLEGDKTEETPLNTNDDYDTETDETINSTPVPKKFREIVDNVLSPDFGIVVEDSEDGMDFSFTLVVPKKYSSLSKEEIAAKKQDLRSIKIPRAKGENGVREWCKLVRQNLNRYYTKEGVKSPFNNEIE